jgi:uncharacterized protein
MDGQLRHDIAEVVGSYPVLFSYVFGSIARGEERADSDVDVAVHFAPGLDAGERFRLCLRLGVDLEADLRRAVDVIDLEEAPLRLAGRILTERVVVTGFDRPERVRYETSIYRPYIDFEYHAARLDRELLTAMAEGRR